MAVQQPFAIANSSRVYLTFKPIYPKTHRSSKLKYFKINVLHFQIYSRLVLKCFGPLSLKK